MKFKINGNHSNFTEKEHHTLAPYCENIIHSLMLWVNQKKWWEAFYIKILSFISILTSKKLHCLTLKINKFLTFHLTISLQFILVTKMYVKESSVHKNLLVTYSFHPMRIVYCCGKNKKAIISDGSLSKLITETRYSSTINLAAQYMLRISHISAWYLIDL